MAYIVGRRTIGALLALGTVLSASALESAPLRGSLSIANLQLTALDITPDDGIPASFTIEPGGGSVWHTAFGPYGPGLPGTPEGRTTVTAGAFGDVYDEFRPAGSGQLFTLANSGGNIELTVSGRWSGIDAANGPVRQYVSARTDLNIDPPGGFVVVVGPHTELVMTADVAFDFDVVPTTSAVPLGVDLYAGLSTYGENDSFHPEASMEVHTAVADFRREEQLVVRFQNVYDGPYATHGAVFGSMQIRYDPAVTPVPEPSTTLLCATGLLGVLIRLGRRRCPDPERMGQRRGGSRPLIRFSLSGR